MVQAARTYLRKFLDLYDELSFFPLEGGEPGERILVSSKIAGLISEFELYVDDCNASRSALEALARLRESLKLANSGNTKTAASMMMEAARLVARLAIAEKTKNEEKHEENG